MKKIFSLLAAVLMAGSMMAQFDTWSVVGSKAIMNGTADWAIAETANDMATEDGVTYTLTVTGKTLEVGTTYEYKYAKGHAWSVSIPQSGNLSLTVTETAVYDIVYTVNVSDKTHSAVATKAGEAGEITHVYSIAGSSADLFGAAWSQTATATEMTKGEDGIYSWTKENVELTAATIEYKVVVDHAWGEAYPSQNATLVIAEAGTYNVVFTFNPADKAVNATATKVGGEPGPGPETTVYYIKHNWGGAGNWTWKEMTREGETGTYTLRDIYGGTGCNWNTVGEDAGATWVATPTLVGEPAVGDSAVFTLVEGEITITKIMGEVGPEPVITKDTAYYFAGETTEWAFAAMPYTVALPKDSTIEFKQVIIVTTTSTLAEEAPVVAHDTIWCGQMTEGYVMTRESMTEAGWVLDGTYNVVLTADAEGDYVFAMNGAALTVTFPTAGPAPEPAIDTLYLVNSKGWGAPKIYFYGGTVGQITAWPGDAMVKVDGVKADGFDVYMFAINHGEQANVIFNNGSGVQSGDLVIAGNEGKYFNFADQTWYESAEAVVCTWYMNANYNGTTEWRELTRTEAGFSRRDVYAPAANYYYNGMAADQLKSEIKGAKLTIDSNLAAGDSAVFTLDPYAKTINIEKIAYHTPVITKDTAMFVAANFTNWAEGMQALPYTVELPADSALEFKQVMQVITYADGVATDTTLTWYGQVSETGAMERGNSSWLLDGNFNVLLTTDAEGEYTFSLNESGEFVVTFPEMITTGINHAEMGELKKMIQNGQLVIIRDGKRYNAMGAQL